MPNAKQALLNLRDWLQKMLARLSGDTPPTTTDPSRLHPSRLRPQGEIVSLGPKATCQPARDSRSTFLLKLWTDLPVEARRELKRNLQVRSKRSLAHALPVLSYGEVQGRGQGSLYAIQDCPGISLREMLKTRTQPLPLDEALSYVRQIALALQAAHRERIVHGNLSPEGVFLRDPSTATDERVVVDFVRFTGLEGSTNAANTVMDLFPTGRDYLAPETLLGNTPDEATDLFNLGLVAYEILTGQKAFQVEGRSTMQRVRSQLEANITPVGQVRSDLPSAVAAAVMHLLRKDRRLRCKTAEEFLHLLAG